jgi:hypothetical protein
MPREIVMFPPLFIAIQEEIYNNHPALQAKLAMRPNATLEEKIAVVAWYCDLAVDGSFSESDLEALFEIILKKLKKKSTIIIMPTDGLIH